MQSQLLPQLQRTSVSICRVQKCVGRWWASGIDTQKEVVPKTRLVVLIKKYVRDIIWGQDFASDLLENTEAISPYKRRAIADFD